jgi:hypothetical protein
MRQRDRRRQVEANRLCGKQPAMPGDEDAIDIDEQRIGESKLPNGSGDFGDLFLRTRSRISRFRLDAVRQAIGSDCRAVHPRCMLKTFDRRAWNRLRRSRPRPQCAAMLDIDSVR